MKTIIITVIMFIYIVANVYAESIFGIYRKLGGQVVITPFGDTDNIEVRIAAWGGVTPYGAIAVDCDISGITKQINGQLIISEQGCSLVISPKDNLVVIDSSDCASYCSAHSSGFGGEFTRIK